MPDVTGKKLDGAKDEIEDSGFDGDVGVDGGGLFGVVKESNWEVCDQSPAAGEALTGTPQLTVDRSCEDDTEEPSETPSEPTSATPAPETESSASAEPEPEATQVLTSRNSKELAAILRGGECDVSVRRFAKNYKDRTIQFDGSVVDVAPHGSYETRFDYLLGPGNEGPDTTVGPIFKYEDVNYYDFNLTGKDAPASIDVGDRFRFLAEVDRYVADTCIFFLNPVETQTR